jgi:CCR4-NOT transcription complex subunit 2
MGLEGVSNSTALSSEDLNPANDSQNPALNDYRDFDPSKREESDADIFGVKGLFGIIKVEESDKSKLALGVDLTSLGLNMNQPEYLVLHLIN